MSANFARQSSTSFVNIDEYDPERKRTNFQAIARRWVELGKGGNLAAIEGLTERILGKPVQPVSGVPDQPIEYRIVTNVKLPHDTA